MFDLRGYDVEIKHHVFIRAMQRGISPDLIEDTIKSGAVEQFANDRVRFVKKGSKRTIQCIGEIRGTKIIIFTIE
jgi:hypothetical protein